MLKSAEYLSIEEPVPACSEKEHAGFLLLYQKAILYALEKRGYLTKDQRERCVTELERQTQRKSASSQA